MVGKYTGLSDSYLSGLKLTALDFSWLKSEGNVEATGRIILLNLVKARGLSVLFWMLV
nr:hypothetical protein Iba_chr14bCG15200 [Ipomoea batatas]